ncbi:T9SS type A sorting domain-containing protein [Flavobacterium enshiense]|uniref:T9SS type A sorting domain-containing protein n=1 Tax=Flavobacterium enshiense TaxID=1341165 RepID=UPI00345CC1D2
MNKKLLILLGLMPFMSAAQAPIFSSGMTIVAGGASDSPVGEDVQNIIDGSVNTKFLDFDYYDGMEFTVSIGTPAIATSIEVTTANDAEGRDPMNYEILGSNDGSGFTSIATGSIACDFTRYFTRTFSFSNSVSYTHYRVLFTNQCSSENSLQVSEVQLFGNVLNVEESALNETDFSIYPNPSKGNFNVKQNGIKNIDRVVIVNTVGEIVKEVVNPNQVSDFEIRTENIASGIYFVKVFSGELSNLRKLILN